MKDFCKYARFRLNETPSDDIPLGARSVGHHAVPAQWVDTVFEVQHIAIYWGIKGNGGITLDGERLKLEPEQIAILFPGMLQEIYSLDREWEYCWWTMDGPLAVEIVRNFGFTPGVHNAGQAPINYIASLESIIQGPSRRNEINASLLAYQLLSVAAQHHDAKPILQNHSEITENATNIILDSWQDPKFNVDQLAENLKVHRSTLSRQFRQTTGTTLSKYIEAIRIQNAIAMLRETTLSMAEISRQCGYSDPNYFSKLMNNKLGMPPTEFRKKN